EAVVNQLKENDHYLHRFCNPSELTIAEEVNVPEDAMSAVITGADIYLPLEGLIDFEKEIARLEKELKKWTSEVELVQKKLANKGFVEKAPEKLVQAEKQKEVDYIEKRNSVETRLNELKNR